VDRVTTIAPFLTLDRDPYLVIADGRLFWMLDAYTLTRQYPYSTRTAGGLNYIRNSVKVVVDAYHGTTTFYLADTADPLVATLSKIFPGMFTPLASMPESLRRHIRYPEDIFSVQTAMFATYHMNNPAVFYNKEDQWEVPAIESTGAAAPMEPYYTIMRLPGESAPEFIQMLPFTPSRKDNLAAWMVARSDGPQYGRLMVFQFPKQKVVFGPRQIVARINQDQLISPQITARHPDRRVAALRPPALSEGRGWQDPRTQARHRRVSEPDRDGRYARESYRQDLRAQPDPQAR
jgi:uncharacterized membrane protein (UPF0182 family)